VPPRLLSRAPDTFAVPIDIAEGVDVTAWQFDLAYDATNVNVNTGCDPFTDPYCSLITGAVTEGAYFASGDPFNLLNPGFVRLDPISFAQDGLLFAVNGPSAAPCPDHLAMASPRSSNSRPLEVGPSFASRKIGRCWNDSGARSDRNGCARSAGFCSCSG
jgi:hypothetical protein